MSSTDQTVLSDSTTPPSVNSSGYNTKLGFAPTKRRPRKVFRSRSLEHFGGVKMNLFDSLVNDVCGDGQTKSPPSTNVCLKDAAICNGGIQSKFPTADMYGNFQPSGLPGARGLVRYRKTDNGFVDDYLMSGVDYAPVDTDRGPVNYSHDEPAAPVSPDHRIWDHFSNDTGTVDSTSCGGDQQPQGITLDNNWLNQLCEDFANANMTFLNMPCFSSVPAGLVDEETLVEAPECMPISTPSEEVDGQVCATGLKLIKSAVVVILQHIISNKLKETCLGCEVDHPSQLRHSCLFEPDSFFFEKYYDDITRLLFTPGLKHAVAGLLKCFGIQLPLLKIQGCAETVVCELRSEPYIVEKLQEIRENLVDHISGQFVADAVDSWEAGSKTSNTV